MIKSFGHTFGYLAREVNSLSTSKSQPVILAR